MIGRIAVALILAGLATSAAFAQGRPGTQTPHITPQQSAQPAAAELSEFSCYELWYSRNLLFDAKGYCFKTPLAQSAFDNSDCTTETAPKFSQKEIAFIEAILAEEKSRACKVN
jgi:hypothetical protein